MADIKYTPCKTEETKINESGNVKYITFPAMEKYPEVLCAFSTKEGGVSRGMFASMNLGRMELDSRENVLENYRIFAKAIGTTRDNFVISDQQHTVNVRAVSVSDRGKGLSKAKDYEAIDGFVTDEKEVALCLLYADCVPVYLYDPDHKAIGLVHSGWKGTAGQISAKATELMKEKYGSRPEDMISVIAPSICRDCYEVSEDLLDAFSKSYSANELNEIFTSKGEGKYMLDLWLASRIVLRNAGLSDENIHTTDMCTCCNSHLLFSHRATKGKRGNLATVIMLRQ